jgi:hypothetical protein
MLILKQISLILILSFITLFYSVPAISDVKVTIGSVTDANKFFLVETGYNYKKFDGNSSKSLDKRLIQSPGSYIIPVNLYNPLLFNYVYVAIFHPAYIHETKSSTEMPSQLKTVLLPLFNPRRWDDFMQAGKKIEKAGPNVNVGDVIGHLNLFITLYLPAMDDTNNREDLKRYIPFFKELIAYTKQTSPHTSYNDKFVDTKIPVDSEYAKRMHAMEQSKLKKLDDCLQEIESLLSLSTQRRIKLRWMRANMINAKSIYSRLMTDRDRLQATSFFENAYQGIKAKRSTDTRKSWISKENNITYTVTIGDVYRFRTKENKDRYQDCIHTKMNVDLGTAVNVVLRNLRNEVKANFCREERGWRLISIGAEEL